MIMLQTRWTICAVAILSSAAFFPANISAASPQASTPAVRGAGPVLVAEGQGQRAARTRSGKSGPPVAAPQNQLPPRVPFTAAEDAASAIPGMPDARFWADSKADYANALPPTPGPWLVLSSGGSDGAFGAGLLNGLTAAGQRPDYAVVTGVSTGALIAPFAFAGSRYDDALKKAFTTVTAADIFEAGASSGESFVNSWPLRDFIGNEITPELMADIAAAHRSGRRLFVITTDLDAERSVVWNMGAIAAHGGEDARALFVKVLLASASVPGAFPPVLIDVEADGKRFAEMHADGGLCGQFFVTPASLMATNSDYRLPATQLYIVVNTGLQRDFKVVERFAPSILSQAVGTAVKADTRMMLSLAYAAAKRSGVEFNVATIPPSFDAPSKGAFDQKYMRALFQTGYDQGRSATPFGAEPPPYPNGAAEPNRLEKTGAN
jgi:predicted acylesterase/phospholipase RssA